MAPKRKFHGTEAERKFATHLCKLTDDMGLDTVREVAEHFPEYSRGSWGDFLNGSRLLPKSMLAPLLKELHRKRPRGWNATLKKTHELWEAAAESAPPSQDSSTAEVVSLQKRLIDKQEALRKAEAVAANSALVIPWLLRYDGHQRSKIAQLTDKVEQLQAKEREEAQRRLELERARHARIQAELGRARNDRFTAEQAQAVLQREQEEARREIERLKQAAGTRDQVEAEDEPTVLLEQRAEPELSEEEIARRIDEQLDLITSDGEERGAMLSEVVEQAGMENEGEDGPRVIPGTVVTEDAPVPDHQADQPPPSTAFQIVQFLSGTTLDIPATSTVPSDKPVDEEPAPLRQDHARAPRDASPTPVVQEGPGLLRRGLWPFAMAVGLGTVTAFVAAHLVMDGGIAPLTHVSGDRPKHSREYPPSPSFASGPYVPPTDRVFTWRSANDEMSTKFKVNFPEGHSYNKGNAPQQFQGVLTVSPTSPKCGKPYAWSLQADRQQIAEDLLFADRGESADRIPLNVKLPPSTRTITLAVKDVTAASCGSFKTELINSRVTLKDSSTIFG